MDPTMNTSTLCPKITGLVLRSLLLVTLMFLESCEKESVQPAPSPIVYDLKINLQLDTKTYDSVIVLFSRPDAQVQKKLVIDETNHRASATIEAIDTGTWKIAIAEYRSIQPGSETHEDNGTVSLIIASNTTVINSDGLTITGNGQHPQTGLAISWTAYFDYYLHSSNKRLKAFLRLPEDPLNPLVELTTFDPSLIYVYADRTFYNSGTDGSAHFVRGSGAFEVYEKIEHVVDTTSLLPVVSAVKDKNWNLADALVIIEGSNDNEELTVYHIWPARHL
jgi:hypothetical protein